MWVYLNSRVVFRIIHFNFLRFNIQLIDLLLLLLIEISFNNFFSLQNPMRNALIKLEIESYKLNIIDIDCDFSPLILQI